VSHGRGPHPTPLTVKRLVRVTGVSDLPPADWYTDPEDESLYRYWDGSAWTEHRAPRHSPSDGETAPGPGRLRRPGRLLADTFSVAGRRWRNCAAAALIYLVGQVAMVVLLLMAADSILMGELGEIWERVSDPDFDPEAPEQTAYFESLEADLSPVNFVPLVLGVGAVWFAGNLLQATVMRVVLSDLRGRPLTATDALRQALGRVPRLMGLDLQVAAILLIAVTAALVGGALAPLLLILLVPAVIVGAVYLTVVVSMALAYASVGPATPSLPYGARLVRGRFWATFGRLLLVLAVLTAVSLALGVVTALAGIGSPAFAGGQALPVVSQLVQTVVGTAATVVGMTAAAIIYHDLGGDSE